MLIELWKPIAVELQQVDNLMRKLTMVKKKQIFELAPLEINYFDRTFRPALVILTARACGHRGLTVVPLAAAVQFIYLASTILNQIGDNDQDLQFPVLVGDYLYGRFFELLGKYNLLEHLGPLAGAVCRLQEGGVYRKETIERGQVALENFLQVIEKEHVPLLEEACRAGAVLAGSGVKQAGAAGDFGRHLGFYLGAAKYRLDPEFASRNLISARRKLQSLPEAPEILVLNSLINFLEQESGNQLRETRKKKRAINGQVENNV